MTSTTRVEWSTCIFIKIVTKILINLNDKEAPPFQLALEAEYLARTQKAPQ